MQMIGRRPWGDDGVRKNCPNCVRMRPCNLCIAELCNATGIGANTEADNALVGGSNVGMQIGGCLLACQPFPSHPTLLLTPHASRTSGLFELSPQRYLFQKHIQFSFSVLPHSIQANYGAQE